jgi:3-oxoacid CoA-transferase subunit B
VDKAGRPKILKNCNLPLTAKAKVDMIITDLAVFEVDRHGGTGMTLIEVAEGVTVEEIRSKTQADFKVADNLKSF